MNTATLRLARMFFAISAMFTLLVVPLAAQQSGPAEPEETEIVIPDLVLEVEELGVEQVDTVLPGDTELALGQIALPLPGAEELTVSDITFSAPLPSVAARREGPSVFSTGRLGAGSANRVIGELSIYKLGADPRFRLGFTHEGVDGFQFNPAGSGFYAFTNTIDAWLSMQNETMELEASGGFSESERGLQDQSDYNAVSLRATDATAELVYLPDPLVTITGNVDAGLATRRQTTTGAVAVPRDQEYVIEPSVSARFDVRALDLVFQSSYFLRLLAGEAAAQQDLDLTAGFEATLPWSLVVGGHAGVHWDFSNELRYPWSLSVQGVVGDALELRASGGFRVDRTRLSELWASEPLLATTDSLDGMLVNNDVWYAHADARWNGAAGLSLSGEVDFSSESDAIDLQPFDTGIDEFPFVQRELLTLQPSVRAAWQPSPVWQFETGWTGHFLDRTAIQPVSVIDGTIRFSERTGVFRANLEAVSELHPTPEVPWIGIEGTLTASEGVEVVIEIADLLSPLFDGGRPTYGPAVSAAYPFIEPGFMVTLFTRITL